jgi:toxin ParE1/3/4
LIDNNPPKDLRFARPAQPFVVFVDDIKRVIIIDFLHCRAELPRRLASLPLPKSGGEH